MEVTFDVNKLDGMKRPELQKLCKEAGIKANMKNAQLIEALKQYASQFSGTCKRKRSSITSKQQLQNPNSSVVVEAVVKKASDQENDSSESYRKQLLDQLEKKVEEKMPVECKIPRFVQFVNNSKSSQQTNKTPAAKWSKIHNAQFEKMDSIDVYLEKKRKRMESFNLSAKRAKSIGVSRKSVDKSANIPVFKPTVTNLNKSGTFVFGSPTAKPFFQPVANKKAKVSIATSASGSRKKLNNRLKSPKVFKPILSGGNEKTAVVENKPKTPAHTARKSIAATPFRFVPANIPAAPTPTPKKKFDLQASLAKPLPYKPHTGKLKPLPSNKEDCRPTISQSRLKGRKKDVKTAKVKTREERRMKENKSRDNKRANSLSRRRGIPC